MSLYSTSLLSKILANLTSNEINPYLFYYYFQKYVESKDKQKSLKEFTDISFTSFSYMQKVIERQNSIIIQLKKELSYKVKSFEATLIRNAVPGMGIESAFETGISLNFLYGFPYFPSSSLKGIAAEYARSFEDVSENDIKEIFGSQDKEGSVIFFDGLPIESNNPFTVDIITPHYQEYYGGKLWPADYLKPIPNSFLAIKKGVTFRFSLASGNETALNNSFKWLKGALTKLGVGAKTTSGYGHFWKFKVIEG